MAVTAAGEAVGVEVREVVLKDVVLDAELRAAYAAVANRAKLLDEHPSPARLRTVEALPPGAVVKLR